MRANLRRLPFRDQISDAAFMAHVLQLLEDPRPVLTELGRVARQRVVVVVPDWTERGGENGGRARGKRYREIAAELGYSLPERGTRYRHTLEELTTIAAPQEVRVVTGPPLLSLTAEERRAQWGSRMYGRSKIPPEVHAEILRRLEAEVPLDPSILARPRTERFVAWDAADLRRRT